MPSPTSSPGPSRRRPSRSPSRLSSSASSSTSSSAQSLAKALTTPRSILALIALLVGLSSALWVAVPSEEQGAVAFQRRASARHAEGSSYEGAEDRGWEHLGSRYAICSAVPRASLIERAIGQVPFLAGAGEGGGGAEIHDAEAEGRIYTSDPERSGRAAECLVVEDGRVRLVGGTDEVKAWCGERGLKWEDCGVRRLEPGQAIVPGLHDAHGHLLDLGWSLSAADLVGATSIDDVVSRLESYIESRPDLLSDPSLWVQGLGWDQTKWNPSVFPTAADLSSRSPLLASRKIALRRIDVHALWMSEAALKEMEDTGALPSNGTETPGGMVLRDDKGRASGVLIDKAMEFAYKVIPPWTDEDRATYLDAATERLLSVGIVGVGDAAVDLDSLSFLKRTNEANALRLRIYGMIDCPPGLPRCAPQARERGFPLIDASHSARLQVRTRKLFLDGALGSWGSAMWDDYSDRPGERGLLLMPEDDVLPLMRYWVQEGFQVASHAIGDRANTLALDAYETLLAEHPGEDLRLRIEHAQLQRLEDAPRFGRLGVIASMQPTHCTSDMGYVDTRIGSERSKGAYPWQTIARHNGTLALGSDFPVELPDPLHGFYSAISRLDERGDSPAGPGGWHPQERLTRAQALHGFTLAPAHAQFQDKVLGSLSRGKAADFVVLDRDIMDEASTTPLEARNARVLATFIDGRAAWTRESSKREGTFVKLP